MQKRFTLSDHLTDLNLKANVLIGVLNWGLGHATRSIPIIKQFQDLGINPIIASDGAALVLLQKVFPNLKTYTLPAYNITYTKNPFWFGINILKQTPHIFKTLQQEKNIITQIVEKEDISTIISDNRFGVLHPTTKNIYLTHQLRIMGGLGGWIASIWHRSIINQFDFCWIPDVENEPSLSGKLSHAITLNIPKKFIGFLSNFQKKSIPIKYDLLLLLSGPEPQRTLFEKQLLERFENSNLKIVMVQGLVENEIKKKKINNITVYNYLHSQALENQMNASKKIIARSGYTTLMDITLLEKEAELHPTPGQPEQIYLMKHFNRIHQL